MSRTRRQKKLSPADLMAGEEFEAQHAILPESEQLSSKPSKRQRGIKKPVPHLNLGTQTASEEAPKEPQPQKSKAKVIKDSDYWRKKSTQACDFLASKHLPNTISFRDNQAELIRSFIKDSLSDKLEHRCLLLTGMPGAGKTLLSSRVMEEFNGQLHTVYINANSQKTTQSFCRKLYQTLFSGETFKNTVSDPTGEILQRLKKQQLKKGYLVLIDQFDAFFSDGKDPKSLDLFRLFSRESQGIIFLATSNEIELLMNLDSKFKTLTPKLPNIVFKPYQISTVEQIILKRMQQAEKKTGVKVSFGNRALKYICTCLVSSKGSDMRRILDITRSVLSSKIEANQFQENVLREQKYNESETCEYVISISDALPKVKAFRNNNNIISNIPFHERMLLTALYTFFKRDNSPLVATVPDLKKELEWINKSLGLESSVSTSDLVDALQSLESSGCVTTKKKKNEIVHMFPKIPLDEIEIAFSDDPALEVFFRPA